MCGLVAKLRCPEFVQFISDYDIICLQESKTDLSDDICVNGYNVHMLHRQKLSRYRSGGIALLVRDNISSYVTVDTCSKSNLVLLFTVSKELYSSNEDLKCGIVYVPPFGSKFASDDPFFELQMKCSVILGIVNMFYCLEISMPGVEIFQIIQPLIIHYHLCLTYNICKMRMMKFLDSLI